MPYRLVIFDFDGTLADSFPWFCSTVNKIADQHGFRRIAPHDIERLRTLDVRSLLRHWDIPRWKVPWIARHLRSLAASERDQTRLFGGVEDMVDRLVGAGMELALVSSNAEPNVRAILGTRCAEAIRYCECGVSLFGKASRFRRVLRRSGVAANDAICIGDEIRDLEAARQAGIAFGAVTWGYTAPAALIARTPTVVFEKVAAITEWLLADTAPEAQDWRKRHSFGYDHHD